MADKDQIAVTISELLSDSFKPIVWHWTMLIDVFTNRISCSQTLACPNAFLNQLRVWYHEDADEASYETGLCLFTVIYLPPSHFVQIAKSINITLALS